MEDLQRRAMLGAATLIALGMATGLLAGLAMTGGIPADGGAMLASHLNAILGGLWIAAVGLSLPMLRHDLSGKRLLVRTVVVANFANWALTLLKSFLHVKGIGLTGDRVNDVVFFALLALVVLPSLGAAVAWALGLRAGPTAGATSR